MPIRISYMGTKRQLAPCVADVVATAPNGPLLDLFSGICAVGTAVAPQRNVWCNDVQIFASEVGRAFFTSQEVPLPNNEANRNIAHNFRRNRKQLIDRWRRELEREKHALKFGELDELTSFHQELPNITTSEDLELERAALSLTPNTFPYRLFSISFSGGYLGLSQCIDVDSLRYSIDTLLDNGEVSKEQHRWMCIALCQAVCKVSTTTGHFAQFLKVNKNNKRRILAQRRRSVRAEWKSALGEFSPIGDQSWRSQNQCFNSDAVTLLEQLGKNNKSPAVVYADPPYTSDHYSRFYHLYETLLSYDYPPTSGIGRYRSDRFSSDFSIKTKVGSAMEALITQCANLGTHLVLSYPENGLLDDSKEIILGLLSEHFRKSRIVKTIDHFHSSLGGSKGAEKYAVKEIIYAAG